MFAARNCEFPVAISSRHSPLALPSADLGDFYNTSATWTVNVPAGTAVTLSLIDAQDNEAWSGSVSSHLPASRIG